MSKKLAKFRYLPSAHPASGAWRAVDRGRAFGLHCGPEGSDGSSPLSRAGRPTAAGFLKTVFETSYRNRIAGAAWFNADTGPNANASSPHASADSNLSIVLRPSHYAIRLNCPSALPPSNCKVPAITLRDGVRPRRLPFLRRQESDRGGRQALRGRIKLMGGDRGGDERGCRNTRAGNDRTAPILCRPHAEF